MAKDILVEVLDTNLLEHPAAIAWGKVAPDHGAPARITKLKETRRSRVYRLHGAGPGGAPVIAKLGSSAGVAIERAIYEDVLPSLPVTALRFYGLLEDREGHWLFLEDSGNQKYSNNLEEHRAMAGRWLGTMHSSAARRAAPARLPEREPRYYLERLRFSRETICQSLANPFLHPNDRLALEAYLKLYGVVESHWAEVVRLCDPMPRTLVHGDLSAKNARFRASQAGNSLLIFDWDGAGWGVPAVDLAQFMAESLSPDLAAYSSAMQPDWPDAASLVRMAELGRIFWLIVATDWESQRLAGAWLEGPMRNLRIYQAAMADAIRAAGWRC
jgi:hypothetical protein